MLAGGTGDRNLAPIVAEEGNVDVTLSRVRSLLVFSVENRIPKSASIANRNDVIAERWKTMFKKYDSHGHGHITVDDIRRMVRRDLKISERLITDGQLLDFFSAIDEDHGGTVEFNEFLDFVHQPNTRGEILVEDIVNFVVRGVRLAIHRNKIRKEDLEASFRSFEQCGSNPDMPGELTYTDVVRYCRKVLLVRKQDCSDHYLRIAFRKMDTDNSNTISLDEFMEFIKLCAEVGKEKTVPPVRVRGLIGGMRASLPERVPSRRPGTAPEPGSPLARMPFCLNGRDLADTSRLSSAGHGPRRSHSEPRLRNFGTPNHCLFTSPPSTHRTAASPTSDTSSQEASNCLCLSPKGVHACLRSDSDRKRVSGEVPSQERKASPAGHRKRSNAYVCLKGGHALCKMEDRLFEAGIDVRGNYHKLGSDRHFA